MDKEGKDLICPICRSHAKLEDSKIIYGTSYGLSWICENYPECDCYVGCHKGTATPLGELADRQTRRYRKMAHAIFDPLWQDKKYNRTDLYNVIGIQMGKIPLQIAELNVEECKQLIKIIKEQYEI